MNEPEDDYDWRLDAYRCWLLALELARDGNEEVRAWFGGADENANAE